MDRAFPGPELPEKLWRGELPLWRSYWVWGVGGNAGFALLLWWVAMKASDRRVGAGWAWSVYLGSLLWFVFIFGGIWRSAGRYRGRPIWALLARAGVLTGILRMAAEPVLLPAVPAVSRLPTAEG